MKKSIGVLIMMLIITFPGYAQTRQNASKPKLEVLYFHSTMRCATCNAIENNAKKLLNKEFKPLLDKGMIKFNSYNVDQKENKALAEKYRISFSTLLLVKNDGTITDFTRDAFQYALGNPAKYEILLREEIQKKLK